MRLFIYFVISCLASMVCNIPMKFKNKSELLKKKLIFSGASVSNNNEIHVSDLPKPHRVIRPGTFVTEDYDPDRFNVKIDRKNIIQRVYFG